MDEKERYKSESYMDAFSEIHDTQLDIWYLRKDLIVELLNNQDKRIKELEEDIVNYQYILRRNNEVYNKLKEENGYIIFSDGYDENDNPIHKQEFVKYKDKCSELIEENKKLKQSQKELAIEELEKLKNYFCEEDEDGDGFKTGDWTITHDACEVAEFIDNRVKELKGGG